MSAENNNKDFSKWFEVFYDQHKNIINKESFIDLKGSLQRFLESHQSNTGLNLIYGLTTLFLGESLNDIEEKRFTKSLDTISNYAESNFDVIMDKIRNVGNKAFA